MPDVASGIVCSMMKASEPVGRHEAQPKFGDALGRRLDLDLETRGAGTPGPDEHARLQPGVGVVEHERVEVALTGVRIDVGGRECEQPPAERQHDDTERRLGAERTPEPVGRLGGQLVGAIETQRDLLASSDRDRQHRRHRDHLEQQHAAVAATEQLAAVEADQLDHAGDRRDEDRRYRDPAERASGLHEVLFARPGEHDPRDQRGTAEPHRDGEHVDRR